MASSHPAASLKYYSGEQVKGKPKGVIACSDIMYIEPTNPAHFLTIGMTVATVMCGRLSGRLPPSEYLLSIICLWHPIPLPSRNEFIQPSPYAAARFIGVCLLTPPLFPCPCLRASPSYPRCRNGMGVIRYWGPHATLGGNYVGLELDGPRGTCDGTIDGNKCGP